VSSQRCAGRLLAVIFLGIVSLAANKADPSKPVVKVTHRDAEDGWKIAETDNFRLLHHHSREMAEEVLRVAERTRAAQLRKWFDDDVTWNAKCQIRLYASDAAYSEATGVPGRVEGHTDVTTEDERVIARCIHVHGPRDALLSAVLPHEVTHAVLAGRFGKERLPRWADEGMAILAESKPRIERHLRELPRCREDEQLFSMADLVPMRGYPNLRGVVAFHAQSVSLVEFLTHEKGAKTFTAFVRAGLSDGFEAALKRHYKWSYAELDRHWQRHAFPAE
jgi:hypothetical protein